MFYQCYKILTWLCTVVVAGVVFWHPGLRATDLPLVLAFVLPLYLPMAYHVGRRYWLHRQQAALGLPSASEPELMAFISEGLDEAYIDWDWQGAPYGNSLWHTIMIGPEDDPIFVKAHGGVVEVEWGGAESDVFLDPIEALSFLYKLKNVAPPKDADIYGEEDDQAGQT